MSFPERALGRFGLKPRNLSSSLQFRHRFCAPDRLLFALAGLEKFFQRQVDVVGNLAKQSGGNVSALLEGHCRNATVRVSELLVRATLPHLGEPESLENGHHLTRFEDGRLAQP